MPTISQQFRRYLLRRGYQVPLKMPDVLYGWWIRSFLQPSFGHFWRVWNPFIGFWLYKLYHRLGGDRYRVVACLGTFLVAGFCHDLINFGLDMEDGLEFDLTVSFLIWGILVLLLSRRSVLKLFRKFPGIVHFILNICWLAAGLFLARLIV